MAEEQDQPSLTYRRYRAPRADRGMLVEPRWSQCLTDTNENTEHLGTYNPSILGVSLQLLRRQARSRLVASATEFTARYADGSSTNPSSASQSTLESDIMLAPGNPNLGREADSFDCGPLILSGHQPGLFHPGVWAKNFAIDQLARELKRAGRQGSLAIQVIIDNDLLRGSTLVCPAGSVEEPFRASEPFDQFQEPRPYERRFVVDRKLFGSFAERVQDRMRPFVANPLLAEFWGRACQGVDEGQPIGLAFARARHQIELAWGGQTLEIPLSQLCESPEFRFFAGHLIYHASEVAISYNQRLGQYRRLHKIRNHAQPLPNLRAQAGWQETPLWFWPEDDPSRKSIWVRTNGRTLSIGDGEAEIAEVDGFRENPEKIAAVLEEVSGAGCAIRPRALATTMFLRLFLADYFLHGIGGAKYDQVTDLILFDLFGIPAPAFGVLSLTAWLPSPFPVFEAREIIHKQQEIREMYFHPERYLDRETLEVTQVSSKRKTKEKLLGCKPPRGKASGWQGELEQANADLRSYLQEKKELAEKKLSELKQLSPANTMFTSRDWAFCLYPADFLKQRLLDLNASDI